jgi:hypothetical protein
MVIPSRKISGTATEKIGMIKFIITSLYSH